MLFIPVILFMNFMYLTLTASCTGDKEIRQLDVTYHIQFHFDDLKLRTNHRTFSVYYMDDMVLYHLGYHFDSSVNNALVKEEYRRYFFVYRKGERMGYRFDPNDSRKAGYHPVDSLLYKQALGSFSWENLAAIKPIASFDTTSGTLEEIYTNKEMEGDTVWLYFSQRFKEYDFSLSRKLDSLKNLKLFKILVHNSPFYDTTINKTLPEKNSYFLLEQGKLDNLDQVRHYFAEYKKMDRG